MKKHTIRVISAGISLLICMGLVGCGSNDSNTGYAGKGMVYLNYSNGQGKDLQYNNKLYGMNCSNDKEGADPGCFYVSKEEDPEWGGYYYLYQGGCIKDSGMTVTAKAFADRGIDNFGIGCFRSKDLYSWESCGSVRKGSSYVLELYKDDWPKTTFYAPECIRNPKDGKYYLYFSASAAQDWGVSGMSDSSNPYDRFHLAVAVSDTPAGPFHIIYDIDKATGKRIPTINFHTGCNTKYPWAAIDVSPFFDDNGDFYLYFNKHADDHYSSLNGVWGMKMNSMSAPDYSTVSCLSAPGKVSASNTPGQIEEFDTAYESYFDSTEGSINEAPFMYKHKGKYYLTYASNGFGSIAYSVHQAVSDSPLSNFKKLSMEQGNPVLNGSLHGQINGSAHHALVKNGDELWIVYHKHNTTQEYSKGRDRSIAVDRVNFVKNSEGLDVLTANGPSVTLQWLPENISGYKNLAKTAKIEVSNGKGEKYLTDTVLPYYEVTSNNVLSLDKGNLTVTLKWDNPVSVSSVMIYNAYDVNKAFSKIERLKFKLAEKPKWASSKYAYAVIDDLKVSDKYWNKESKEYIQCSPAVAEFEAMKITELQFTIKEDARLVTFNKLGKKQTALNLSEIVVLGVNG